MNVAATGRSATIANRLRGGDIRVTGRATIATRLSSNILATRRITPTRRLPFDILESASGTRIVAKRIYPRRTVVAGAEIAELEREDGLQILELADNGPAAKGRLMVNDIITQVGGVRVQTTDDLINTLAGVDGQTNVVFYNGETGEMESTEVSVQDGRNGRDGTTKLSCHAAVTGSQSCRRQ